MPPLTSTPPASSRTLAKLQSIDSLLQANQFEQALASLTKQDSGDRYLENARAVCLIRAGQAAAALPILAKLIFQEESATCLNSDLPTAFVTNFATAMLMERQVGGCLSALAQLTEPEHPTVQRLRAALTRYSRSLGLWDRLLYTVYEIVKTPIPLDWAPGELAYPQLAVAPQRVA